MSELSDQGMNPIEALERISSKSLNASLLTKEDRLGIVEYGRYCAGMQVAELAKLLNVHVKTIWRDCQEIKATIPERIGNLELSAIINDIRGRAEGAAAKALRMGDPVGSINIWCKCIDKLQSLGALPKVAEKMQLGPIDPDEARDQYRALRELELKADRVIDVEHVDTGRNGQSHSSEEAATGEEGAE
jgi:hypothetical protein